MAWIEVHQALRDHRKTQALAVQLDMPEPHVIGHLMYLWLWALDNAPDGRLPRSARIIARAAWWEGDGDTWVAALRACGWIDDEDGDIVIHDWYDGRHSVKQRSQTRKEWEAMARYMRPAVFTRDNYTCQNCDEKLSILDAEVDHIHPIARGGTNHIDNLQTLCRSCNRRKGAG